MVDTATPPETELNVLYKPPKIGWEEFEAIVRLQGLAFAFNELEFKFILPKYYPGTQASKAWTEYMARTLKQYLDWVVSEHWDDRFIFDISRVEADQVKLVCLKWGSQGVGTKPVALIGQATLRLDRAGDNSASIAIFDRGVPK